MEHLIHFRILSLSFSFIVFIDFLRFLITCASSAVRCAMNAKISHSRLVKDEERKKEKGLERTTHLIRNSVKQTTFTEFFLLLLLQEMRTNLTHRKEKREKKVESWRPIYTIVSTCCAWVCRHQHTLVRKRKKQFTRNFFSSGQFPYTTFISFFGLLIIDMKIEKLFAGKMRIFRSCMDDAPLTTQESRVRYIAHMARKNDLSIITLYVWRWVLNRSLGRIWSRSPIGMNQQRTANKKNFVHETFGTQLDLNSVETKRISTNIGSGDKTKQKWR